MIEILKDVLIAAGDIDRYYEQAPVNLWRARRRSDTGTVFALIEEEKVLSSGQPRPADITIFVRDGVKWVSCEFVPRGISTFDKPVCSAGVPGSTTRFRRGPRCPRGLLLFGMVSMRELVPLTTRSHPQKTCR